MLHEKYGLLSGTERNSNRLLDLAMRTLRRRRPALRSGDAYGLFKTADFTQLWIQTEACRYSKAGRCTVCNYWNGKHLPGAVDELISRDKLPTDCPTLLLNTCGSCLDPLELSFEEQDRLFSWIARHPYQKIILETHADTLEQAAVSRVCQIFREQKVFFEFGIESTSADTLFYCLNKRAPARDVPAIVETVHLYGAACIANVLLGMPFLSKQEQIADAVRSVRELIEAGVDYIVLFPVNIKPYTLPSFLHRHHQYSAVCGDMIVEALSRFPPQWLPRIDVAWYGEHQEEGTIPPYFCPECQEGLPKLLQTYNHAASPAERGDALQKMRQLKCACPPKDGGGDRPDSLYRRLDEGYELIQNFLLSESEVG